VTTFAKCYPSSHPRHSYGVDSLFILMQPEISFSVHEIPVRGPPGMLIKLAIFDFFFENPIISHTSP